MFHLLDEYENIACIAIPQYNFKHRFGIPTRSFSISVSILLRGKWNSQEGFLGAHKNESYLSCLKSMTDKKIYIYNLLKVM